MTPGLTFTFATLLSSLYYWLEAYKGRPVVKRVVEAPSLFAKVKALALDGYELTIYCRKSVFTFYYPFCWFGCSRQSIVFHLYSVASSNAPSELKEVCEKEVHIPVRFHWRVKNEVQQKAAVDAYLDILIQETRRQRNRP